ncbi:bifunctional phosphoglucose/phosphomannose isomerase [Candidatus Wolfebacteria bacterium]|nr:bifunctional phosphoglucose/phosphomannose isomerase [Candidatus Wolfebacteria bacterium]
MLTEAIKNFPKQLEFNPVIENAEKLNAAKTYIVAGMGGSNLATGLIKICRPSLDIIAHRDYGLPEMPDEKLKNSLIIACSYSGNTEETIDAFKTALDQNLPIACVSVNGKLLELAKNNKIPYVQIPDTGIQPRSAVGFMIISLLGLMGRENAIEEIKKTAKRLDLNKAETDGKILAEKLNGKIPVIYSSSKNESIAYNWKIRFNETGKTPAFYNIFPELNHNEMVSFDIQAPTKQLTDKFHFIFLKDKNDHLRIQMRMEILENIYRRKGLAVENYEIEGINAWEKIFSSLIVADWASYYTATAYGLNPEEVEIVEEFKKLLKEKN